MVSYLTQGKLDLQVVFLRFLWWFRAGDPPASPQPDSHATPQNLAERRARADTQLAHLLIQNGSFWHVKKWQFS